MSTEELRPRQDRADARPAPEDVADADLAAAREELRLTEEALREQQQRLERLLAERSDPHAWRRSLVRSIPVATFVTDSSGRVLEVNQAAASLLARAPEQLLRRPLQDLVHPAHRPTLDAVLAALGPGTTLRSVRLDVLTGDGSARSLELTAGPDGSGRPEAPVTWVLVPDRLDDGADEGADGKADEEDHRSGVRAAEAFAELCRLPLETGADTRDVLARAALLVEKAIPRSDGVSITLGPPSRPEAQATDNRLAQVVDGAQLQAGEGPCLSAYETGSVVVCQDLREDHRWQRLAPLAVPAGVAAVLGVPISGGDGSLGVLNVYSRGTDVFDTRDRRMAELLVQALLAVVQETRDRQELTELGEQLRRALDSRGVIDQAKGILMARGGHDAEAAFAELVAASRRSNVKVRDVAQLVVDDASRGSRGEGRGPGDQAGRTATDR